MSNEEKLIGRTKRRKWSSFINENCRSFVSAAPGCQFARDGYGGLVVYRCLHCKHQTRWKSGLKRHLISKHGLTPQGLNPQMLLKPAADNKLYKCPFCDSITRSEPAYQRHLLRMHRIKDSKYQDFFSKPSITIEEKPKSIESLSQSKKRKRPVDGEGNKIESSSNVSATLKKDTKAQVSTVTFASKKYPYVDENQRPLKIYEVVYNYDILCRNREKLLFPQTSKKM